MENLLRTLRLIRGAYMGRFSLLANTVTAGSLGCVGDVVAQMAEQKSGIFVWDAKRTRNMTLICCMAGPFIHYWYKFLDGRYPGQSFKVVSRKLGIDMLSAPFWYAWYVGGISLLRGDSRSQMTTELKTKVPIVLAVDVALWPIFQGFNFALFRPQYRVLVLNCNELVFDVIFSHIANHDYKFSSCVEAVSESIARKK